ncbi:MAG: hydroxymethylbilane synthase [Tepidisphaeraceae bacterium]|jgi:hydroxymethylbilane synthase
MPTPVTLRLGTRGSLLALAQSNQIAADLRAIHPNLTIEIIVVKTTGDLMPDTPLHDSGGKGLFVKELEQAILARQIDFAVHSFKDVPVTMPLTEQSNLHIPAAPKRHDPRDLLISQTAATLNDLPLSAKIATGSLRRRCQLLALRPDLKIDPIRGNIDTRLKKLRAGKYDAVILAAAGIQRAGLLEPWMHPIPPDQILPAPGQGALALQCRRDDPATTAILKSLDHLPTHRCVTAERQIVEALKGDCHSPIAALAELSGEEMRIRAAVGGQGGEPPVLLSVSSTPAAVCNDLLQRGAAERLHPSR